MIFVIAITSLTMICVLYKTYNYIYQPSLDIKLAKYDEERDNIDGSIEYYTNKIRDLQIKKEDTNEKITVLLSKKIITFHEEHQKYNNTSIQNIRDLIAKFSKGNQYIENKVYTLIDPYFDVDQIKKSEIIEITVVNSESDINNETFEYVSEDTINSESDLESESE